MHNFIVNASLQVLPIVRNRHPMNGWMTPLPLSAIGYKYEVGTFATVLEGRYLEVMQVIHDDSPFFHPQIASFHSQ